MLTVEIKINGRHLAIVEAVNKTVVKDVNKYKISVPIFDSIDLKTGKIEYWKEIGYIEHKYSDGAIVLGQKMLEMLEENKDGNTI